MYIKKQDSEDKTIQEINKILNKDIITKEDKLKVDKLIQTLYKDIKLLDESYKVISLTPFNMFPKTKHIETVCLLEKE